MSAVRRVVFLVPVLAGLVAVPGAPPAAADVVAGLGCGLATATAGGGQTGVLYAGPLAVAPTYRVEVTCAVRVGDTFHYATGSGIAVAVVAAPVSFAAAGEPVEVCTSVEWSILIPQGSLDAGCRPVAYTGAGYLLEPAPVTAGP